MPFPDSPEIRRDRYTRLAALAQANAARAHSPEAHEAWLRLVRSWTARAGSEDRLN